jgi:hypothetical protein
VLGGTDKIIIDPSTAQRGSGVVPYLPLGELGKPPSLTPARPPQVGGNR